MQLLVRSREDCGDVVAHMQGSHRVGHGERLGIVSSL